MNRKSYFLGWIIVVFYVVLLYFFITLFLFKADESRFLYFNPPYELLGYILQLILALFLFTLTIFTVIVFPISLQFRRAHDLGYANPMLIKDMFWILKSGQSSSNKYGKSSELSLFS